MMPPRGRAVTRAAALVVAAVLVGSCDTRQEPDPLSGALRGALERLVDGPGTPEASSWFSPETAHVVRSAVVDTAGRAVVDFRDLRPLIPNASSSAGSEALLAELNAVVFGFPEIRAVEYRMEGSCALFWEWLQYDCHTVERAP